MRKFNLIILLSISFLFAAAQDQGGGPVYRNSLKINPLSFFSSTFLMSYERLTGNDQSLNFSAGLISKDSDNKTENGFRGEFQFRYFVLERNIYNPARKLYFAPFVFDQYVDVTDRNTYNIYGVLETRHYNVNAYGAGIVMGVNWVFSRRFVVDAFLGGGVRTSNMNTNDNIFNDDGLMGYGYKGIFPRVGLDLGFTF
jgi:hypothetical protein